MPRCRTYLSSSGTPVHTCCLRFCPRNSSSSSSHHGNVSANDDIQEVHHVPVCIPLPSFAKAFFNFSFSRERRNQQQEPHLTPSQPASQPVSPACPAQCRERATSQKQKGREGKGRGDDSHEKTAGHAPHGFAKPPRILLCVCACVRVQCHYYYDSRLLLSFGSSRPGWNLYFSCKDARLPEEKSNIRVRYDDVSQTITELM